MKKLILAIFILCLFFGGIGMAALPAPVLYTNTSLELAGSLPPVTASPLPPIQVLPQLNVAWNS